MFLKVYFLTIFSLIFFFVKKIFFQLDNIRGVLDEMQKKVLTLEEENESLKKQVEFQQILFEKEKIDLIKNAEAGSQNEILELKSVKNYFFIII